MSQRLPGGPVSSAQGHTIALFRLDFSTLSGENLNYAETALQEKGYSITLEWVQDGLERDIRVVGHAVRAVGLETMDTDFPTSTVMASGVPYGVGLYGAGGYGGALGSGTGFFILDSSTLAGDTSVLQVHTALQERGRGIQIEWSQAGSDHDIHVIGHAVRAVPAETHALEPS